ncbi:ATP-binding protein, partial [Spirochaetota bacterium]
FKLAPFVVGIYESEWQRIDHELAHMVEHYFNEGGTEGLMRPHPALHRVAPAQNALSKDVILPYDDIKSLIERSEAFELRDCICRKKRDLLSDRKCDFTLKACLVLLPMKVSAQPFHISKEEALKVLDMTEEEGLVHTVTNVAKGVYYVCNCCACCCDVMSGIIKHGIEHSLAKANYYAVVNESACNVCGICEKRCHVKAIKMNDTAVIDRSACIGCGLCVTGCPEKAVKLEKKSDKEIKDPPATKKEWDEIRRKDRGMT